MKFLADFLLAIIAIAFVVWLVIKGEKLRTGLEETEIYDDDKC